MLEFEPFEDKDSILLVSFVYPSSNIAPDPQEMLNENLLMESKLNPKLMSVYNNKTLVQSPVW